MKGVQRKASEYAICEMKVYQSVDRSALKNAYEKAKTILKNTKADFAYASANTDELAELWNASVRAKAVYGDVMAGQEELDAAKAELESAQNAYLKKVTGCKETLTEEIKVSEKFDLSKYTSESDSQISGSTETGERDAGSSRCTTGRVGRSKERTGRGKKKL